MLASHDENPIEDEALLTGTGSGGVFTSGYLREKPLIQYLGAEERVAYLLSNKKKGVRRETDSDATVYAPGDGYQAIAAITDTRVLFVVGDVDEGDGDEMFAVPYTDIENVKTSRGMLTKRLDIWTTDGVRWRFFVKTGVDIEPATDYLELAAVVWTRVERQLYHVDGLIEDIEALVADEEFDEAKAVAETAREHVREARKKARELTTNRDDAVWNRIVETERELGRAVMDAHVARAEYVGEQADRYWRQETYNKALDAYETAHDQYEEALSVARDHDLEETTDLREEIDDVTQRIDHLKKAPLQRAEETRDRAEDVDDPEIEADLWEDALEKYQTAMVLGWGEDEQRFAGDTDEIREELARIVDRIEEARLRAANRYRVSGYWHYKEDQYQRAREQFAMALDHVEQALSIADELKPSVSPDLRHARDDLEAKIEETQKKAGEAVFEFVNERAEVAAESAAEFARATAKSTARDEPARPTRADIRERVRDVSPRRFRQFVAYTWERLGYETSLREDDQDVDIVATQEHPVPEKQLLVTEQAADRVTRETILQSATVRDADRDADVVAFVTTGEVTDGAHEVAEEHNVKLIDGERLCDILVTEGLSPDSAAFERA